MQDYEEELKKILQTITPNVDTYYGEFSSLNDIKIDHNKMPAIYVDFLGENPINSYQQKLSFSLYLVAASFSKNEKTRDDKRYSIYSLITEVNKALHLKPILESEPIILKPSKKILDAKAQNAYLVIFQKNIEFTVETNLLEGELVE